jgi:hypothetical protein
MPRATSADLRLVAAYVATGRTKIAAYELGMHHDAYRQRLSRLYRRQGVHSMAALLLRIDPDMSQTAGLLSR